MLRELKPQSKSTKWVAFINIWKLRIITLIIKLLVLVAEVLLILIENLHENSRYISVHIHAPILVQTIVIDNLLVNVLNPAMVILSILLKFHFTKKIPNHKSRTTYKIILALANAPPAITTFLLDNKNYQILHPLNHVQIVIEFEHTQIGIYTPIVQYTHQPRINLTQQPTSSTHTQSSTEPESEINMYLPATSPHLTSSTPTKNHANAIIFKNWFVSLLIYLYS